MLNNPNGSETPVNLFDVENQQTTIATMQLPYVATYDDGTSFIFTDTNINTYSIVISGTKTLQEVVELLNGLNIPSCRFSQSTDNTTYNYIYSISNTTIMTQVEVTDAVNHIVETSTISNADGIYDNGLSGIGATLTLNSNWQNLTNGILICCAYDKIYKSEDYGHTWNSVYQSDSIANYFNAVSYLGNGVVLVGSELGDILRSTDNGITWSIVTNAGTSVRFILYIGQDTVFYSKSGGAGAGQAGVYKSVDAGATWNPITIPTVTGVVDYALRLSYANNRVFIGVGSATAGSQAVWYSDGDYSTIGATWTKADVDIANHSQFQAVYSVATLENDVVLASSYGGLSYGGNIFKSTDGGVTFPNTILVDSTINVIFQVTYIGGDGICLCGGGSGAGDGNIYRSTNYGNTWTKIEIDTNLDDCFCFSNMGNGTVICGVSNDATPTDGDVYISTDWGLTWTKYDLNYYKVSSIAFLGNGLTGTIQDAFKIDDTSTLVFGSFGINKTIDGGSTWFNIATTPLDPMYSARFWNSLIGVCVGANGNIQKTTDGGVTWSVQTSGTLQDLFSITMISSTVYWACGRQGVILNTTDGGSTWSIQTSGTIEYLYSIYGVSANVAYACGNNSTLLKTTDGGTTWSPLTSGVVCDFRSVKMTTTMTGFVCGNGGNIIKTTNAGSSWSSTVTDISHNFNEIGVVDSSTIYIVGDGGLLAKTTNTGSSWSTTELNTTENLNGIYVLGVQGLIVGNNGVIFQYIEPNCFDSAISVNDRLLVQNQSDQTQNGVYVVTSVGSINIVLTRATDYDEPSQLEGATISVTNGAVFGGKDFEMTTTPPLTIGTSNILWTEI